MRDLYTEVTEQAEALKGTPEEGAILKTVRRRFEITQEELAAASGISRSALASFETGRRRPTEKVVKRLYAAILKLSKKRPDTYTAKFQMLADLLERDAPYIDRIKKLEQEVRDLRALYEVGVEAALAHEKFETLREKLSTPAGKEDQDG